MGDIHTDIDMDRDRCSDNDRDRDGDRIRYRDKERDRNGDRNYCKNEDNNLDHYKKRQNRLGGEEIKIVDATESRRSSREKIEQVMDRYRGRQPEKVSERERKKERTGILYTTDSQAYLEDN